MFLIRFIKNYWKDPVWSKVFAAGIIFILSSISFALWSVIQQIPYRDAICKFYNFLTTHHIVVELWPLFLFISLLIILLVPTIIIRQKLRRTKLPASLKEEGIDLEKLLNGLWKCEYQNVQTGAIGKEEVIFTEGNKYYIKGKLYFILENITMQKNNTIVSWDKMAYPQNSKHSTETLTIIDTRNLVGSDSTGHTIKYTKI